VIICNLSFHPRFNIINIVPVLNDKTIRSSLIPYIKNNYNLDLKNDLVVSEISLLREGARADVVMVNGVYHCFEIKSEVDTLERLEGQLSAYRKYFDMVTVVCTQKHLAKIKDDYPKDVGILLVEYTRKGLVFKTIRECTYYVGEQHKLRIDFLWKDELVTALIDKGFKKGLKYKNKTFLREVLLDSYNKSELDTYIKKSMRQRPNWKAVEVLV
jgi:hypothetical protein